MSNSGIVVCNPFKLFNPQRLDLVVKWRLFRHFLNGTYPQAPEEYNWHIDQRIGASLPTSVYVKKALSLFCSMRDHGFDPRGAVPLNKHGMPLDGAHRIGCSAALRIPVCVKMHDTDHQWPDWGEAWFLGHGMKIELPGILADYKRLTENTNG